MTATAGMVLAAGLGTRMRPLTLTRPKALVTVGGRALIDFPVRTLAAAGITRVVVNLHHLGDQVRSHLGDGGGLGVEIRYSEEPVLMGSGGGIRAAKELLGTSTFVTMNADTLVGIELGRYIEEHRRRRAVATLVLRKDVRMEEFGTIAIAADGQVRRFLAHEARGPGTVAEPYMFTGVQILEPRIFDYMTESEPFSITEATYPRLLAAGERVFGAVFEGPWLTVGTPEELILAEAALAARPFDWPAWMRLS